MIESEKRNLPSFLILGAQKAGTTSLYHDLRRHPQIANNIKETNFFQTKKYKNGLKFYKNFFHEKNKIHFDTTPILHNPFVPERVFNALPNIKMIVLLRNPVDRMWSQIFHDSRHGRRNRATEALKIVDDLVKHPKKIEEQKQTKNTLTRYMHVSWYKPQLDRWFQYFDREQFFIIKSERYFLNSLLILEKILNFLELPLIKSSGIRANAGAKKPITQEIRNTLNKLFTEQNIALKKLLGDEFTW